MFHEIEINQQDLDRMKKIELEMLVELDRICRKHEIKYNLCAGTLLGAVRHKGFIPWDDDIDVRMLRSEYKRFCEACKTELDSTRFFWQTYDTDPGYRWEFGRMLRKGTEYVRVGQETLKQKTGVFIDVFPSDGVPTRWISKKIYYKTAFVCRKILWSPVGARLCEKRWQRIGFRLLSILPAKLPFFLFDCLAARNDERNAERVCCMGLKSDKNVFNDGEKIQKFGLKREWHTDLIEMEFEGHLFWAPKDYDGWLVEAFGTRYMELPPVEKRKIHHTVSSDKRLEE